jgi:peptidoglycan hydrolase-like protein with peptidoglycan-binding domain
MFKQKIAAGLLGLAMVLPMIASADTTSDAQNQIQTLLSQIKALQEQIRTIIGANPGIAGGGNAGTTTPNGGPCFMPTRSLGMGAHGDDVKGLQEMLRNDRESGFTGTTSGFFGPQTAKALGRWQHRMGISSSTDGSVGPRTQDFFRKRCGGEGRDGHGMKGGMMMNMPAHITGSITLANGNAITIAGANGQSVVVNITGTTTIKVFNGTSTAPTAGSVSDLIVGKKIAADGPKNADGSITAVHVMVGDTLPMMNMMGQGKDGEHGGMMGGPGMPMGGEHGQGGGNGGSNDR